MTRTVALESTYSIDSRIVVPGAVQNVFSRRGYVGDMTFVRNPNCWTHDIDLTCWSGQVSSGNGQSLTLISPSNIYGVNHWIPANGTTVYFVTKNNVVKHAVITAGQSIPNDIYNDVDIGWPDIWIGQLDRDLTEEEDGIRFARIMPTDFLDYLPPEYLVADFTQGNYRYPNWTDGPASEEDRPTVGLMFTNRARQCSVAPGLGFGTMSGTGITRGFWLGGGFTTSPRKDFYTAIIGGDSGSPLFMLLGGEAILLGSTSPTGLEEYTTEINEIMADLGSSYTLTHYDLAAESWNYSTPAPRATLLTIGSGGSGMRIIEQVA